VGAPVGTPVSSTIGVHEGDVGTPVSSTVGTPVGLLVGAAAGVVAIGIDIAIHSPLLCSSSLHVSVRFVTFRYISLPMHAQWDVGRYEKRCGQRIQGIVVGQKLIEVDVVIVRRKQGHGHAS